MIIFATYYKETESDWTNKQQFYNHFVDLQLAYVKEHNITLEQVDLDRIEEFNGMLVELEQEKQKIFQTQMRNEIFFREHQHKTKKLLEKTYGLCQINHKP